MILRVDVGCTAGVGRADPVFREVAGFEQGGDCVFGGSLVELSEELRIEGGDDDLDTRLQAGQLGEGSGDHGPWCGVGFLAGFQLHVAVHPRAIEEIDKAGKRGEGFAREGRAEPGASVYSVQIPGRAGGYRAGGVGGAVQRGVVEQDRCAILEQVNVRFEPLNARAVSQFKRGQGVFRCAPAQTAVRNNLRSLRGQVSLSHAAMLAPPGKEQDKLR